MKYLRTILSVVVLATFIVLAGQTEYNNGYKEGYKKGWCYGHTFCMEPFAPIPPIAPLGRDTYNDGYNDGFLKGIDKRKASGK